MRTRSRPKAPLVLAILLVLAGAACGGGTAGASIAPVASPGSSPAASLVPVTTPEQATERVVATEPRLNGVPPRQPDSIGATSWYEATPAGDGFRVEVYVGWGDCISGCIDDHTWTYSVARDGTVSLVSEEGVPVPDGEWPSPGGTGRTGVFGTAVAGPVCPVEQPGDPNCAPRPVPGARVLFLDEQGAEAASAETDAAGRLFVELSPGRYTVAAQPVEGLMGVPAPLTVDVDEGESVIELPYDTGIR